MHGVHTYAQLSDDTRSCVAFALALIAIDTRPLLLMNHWKLIGTMPMYSSDSTIGGATPKFLGGPNLQAMTDVIQAIYGL